MKPLLLVALSLGALQLTIADDFKTADGHEYKNVKVSRVEPDGIVVTFSGGIVKISFTELSPEIQKKYGYDPQTAANFQQQIHQADVLRAQQLAEAAEKRRQELEALSKSQPQPTSAPPPTERHSASSMHGTALDHRPSGPTIAIYGKVMQVVDEGVLISVRETNAIGAERIPNLATVLVVGNFPGVYDDDKVQVVGRLVGANEYTTVMGSKRTVRALAGASVTKLTEFPANVR